MKILISIVSLLAFSAFSADVKLQWVNGDNSGATTNWQTIIYFGTSSSNYTSQVTVNWPTSQVTITNLQAGRRYYFVAAHTDLEDISDFSNEVNSKTKINKPQALSIIP